MQGNDFPADRGSGGKQSFPPEKNALKKTKKGGGSRGEESKAFSPLAKDLEATGFTGLVVNIAKIIYRIQALFKGIWEGIDFSGVLAILAPVGQKIVALVTLIGSAFSSVLGGEVTSSTDSFTSFGNILGGLVTFALEGVATMITILVNNLSIVFYVFSWVASMLRGDFAGAAEYVRMIWDTLVANFMAIADLFGIGDWLRDAWADATAFLSSINLYECGAKILDTLKQGILSQATAIKDSVTGVFNGVRGLLPFSDAREGPFSQLTLNGARIMTTLAQGVTGGASTLYDTVSDTLQNASKNILPGEFAVEATGTLTPQTVRQGADNNSQGGRVNGTNTTIHIGQVVLPNATDGKGFLQSLQDLVTEYGGGLR